MENNSFQSFKGIWSICFILFMSFSSTNAQVNVYNVTAIADIQALSPATNDIVYTSTGAHYLISNTNTVTNIWGGTYSVDTCVVVLTANGKYAIMQVRDEGFYAEDFGAIPNDVNSDSRAIQKCIDAVAVIKSVGRVNIGPGEFVIDTGLVIAHQNSSGVYATITMTLSGHSPLFGNITTSSPTVFLVEDDTSTVADFGVAIQLGRKCVIENIHFKGTADLFGLSKKEIIEFTDSAWESRGARINRYSPSCAIVIDPFHNSVPLAHQYPLHSDRYNDGSTSSTGGTSTLTIRDCAFNKHYVVIANNPSNYINNGDNIRIENSYVETCHTFWSAGQTQSRSNSIDNIYSTYLKYFIDCSAIGSKKGTPPVVSNCNIAGFTKEFIHLTDGGFSNVRVNDTYMETIFSLGYAPGTDASFHQCQISFDIPNINAANPEEGDDVYIAPYHFKALNASFVDCRLQFFSNCTYKRPFVFMAEKVAIRGGYIEGGVVVAGGQLSGLGREYINAVNYEDTYIQCPARAIAAGIAGGTSRGLSIYTFKDKILLGGDEVQFASEVFMTMKNYQEVYNAYPLESVNLTVNDSSKTASFTVADPGRYQLDDNIFQQSTATAIDPAAAGMSSVGRIGALGFVSAIDTATKKITISGVPYGVTDGTRSIDCVGYPILSVPVWGDITSGSDTIKNVDHQNQYSLMPTQGMKIFNPNIPRGARITYVDASNDIIVISSKATSTETHSYLYNAKVEQKVYWDKSYWPPTTTGAIYIEGANINFIYPSATVHGYVVRNGGNIGSSYGGPVFDALTH